MIQIEKKENKKYIIYNDAEMISELNLVSSTITNKFHIVTSFIEAMSKNSKEFTEWFTDFMKEYSGNINITRFEILDKNIDNIKFFVNEYIDKKNIDFSLFVDESKSKKNSILFSKEEIECIIKTSSYFKIYCLIFNSENFKMDSRLHKIIYNKLASELVDTQTMFKIFNVIKSKTFRYNITDKYMWNYINNIQNKTIDVHVIEIFNFIMHNILVLCEDDRNPITYFIGVVEESVKWFLRSIYKGTIVYTDTISTEDIQSSSVNNVKTYSYNDTLGNLKIVSYNHVCESKLEKGSVLLFSDENDNDDNILTEFENRMSKVEHISPLCNCIVYPILSKITNIPYNHLKTISPKDAAILSMYVQNLMKKVFKNEYKNIINLLEFYPSEQISEMTTYKTKDICNYINLAQQTNNFYGFKTKTLQEDIIRFFIGKTSRVKFINAISNKPLNGIPLTKIEEEMISFFTNYFSGNLESKFEEMKNLTTFNI